MNGISFDYSKGEPRLTVSENGTVIRVPFDHERWQYIQHLFWVQSLSPKAIAKNTGYSEAVVRIILKRMPRLIVTHY